jgi:hypothetical protein
METRDGIRPRVNVRIVVGDDLTGEERVIETHNTVTDDGLELMRDLFIQKSGVSKVAYIAFGTGTTAPDNDDEALEAEVHRAAFVIPEVTDLVSSVAHVTYYFYLGSAAGALGNITEMGLLNAESDGSLFARVTFDAIAKTATSYIKVEWVVGIEEQEV